jgi:putative ABC transport system permease protein
MGSFIQDLRYALRGLAKNPGFLVVAVATLGIGMGAMTSLFSVADGVLLRPLPFPDPERLVVAHTTQPASGDYDEVTSGANYLDWVAQSRSFEDLAGFRRVSYSLVGGEIPHRVRGVSVTPQLFSVLGVQAFLGRTLTPALDTPGAQRTVALAYSLWQSEFGADPGILDRVVSLDGEPFTVVGVMPPGFVFPGEGDRSTLLWTSPRYRVPDPPFDFGQDPSESRGAQYMEVIGRLREGVGLEAAQSEMTLIAERLADAYPEENAGEGIRLVPLHEFMVADARPLLGVLLGAVGFVLLIACANVANLLLFRASRRNREIAIRRALGASGKRLVRQLLTESVLLAALGGVLGTLLALWGTDALLSLAAEEIPRAASVGADWRTVGFELLLILGTGVVFGLAPLTQLRSRNLRTVVSEGGAHTGGPARSRLGNSLIVVEVAVSLVLLVGAGLLGRTFLTLLAVETGFDSSDTLVANVELPATKYPEDHDVATFFREVLGRLEAMPDVESAGTILTLPIRWAIRGELRVAIEGRAADPGEEPAAGFQAVSGDYFQALRIPLLRGRFLGPADGEEGQEVALVNQAMAERYWPEEDPIGRRIAWGDPEDEDTDWVTIVGVVGNTVMDGLDGAPRPEAYHPYIQSALPYGTLVVRGTSAGADLAAAVRTAVAEVDAERPLSGGALRSAQLLRGSTIQGDRHPTSPWSPARAPVGRVRGRGHAAGRRGTRGGRAVGPRPHAPHFQSGLRHQPP